ncbi:MAG: CoA transferase, partial [Pseudolabrys sp.]
LGLVGQPFKLSRTPSKIAARPPNLSEHTDEVLKEFGFADKEIADLHAAKAV